MLKINIDHDVIINEIKREVKMNEMLCATHYLKSDSFAGCYAIVAEFTQGQKIVGMLGHYDPMHIFLFEREFPFAVRSLEKQNYRLRKMFVCCKDISNFDRHTDDSIEDGFARVKKCVSGYDTTFIQYTGERMLLLFYRVQHRYFTFGKDRSLVSGK